MPTHQSAAGGECLEPAVARDDGREVAHLEGGLYCEVGAFSLDVAGLAQQPPQPRLAHGAIEVPEVAAQADTRPVRREVVGIDHPRAHTVELAMLEVAGAGIPALGGAHAERRTGIG